MTAPDDDQQSATMAATVRHVALQVLCAGLIAYGGWLVLSWRQMTVLIERVNYMTEQMQDIRSDLQQIRRDIYGPRFDRGESAANHLPPGRP